MREVIVLGVGMTKFGRYPDKSSAELGSYACFEALKDSGLSTIREIPIAYCGHVYQGMTIGEKIIAEFGCTGIPVVNVENACASGSTAFRLAYQSIAAGFYDIALALGVEKMPRGLIDIADKYDIHREMGLLTMPAKYAMIAQRYINDYGLSPKQLAYVSVKNHKNGCHNPYSQYKKELTIDEVLNSRMVCDPLTLYQCCPTGDGAAAVILSTEEIGFRLNNSSKPLVRVAAASLSSQVYVKGEPYDICNITTKAAKEAYETAGIGPQDLDAVELHDCFTIAEISHYENLMLCKRGKGMRLIEEKSTEIGGRIPVNPSGGLLAKGHPLGATGVAQIVELTLQLRGDGGKRQIEGAKVGLAHTMGGGAGMACSVTILKK